MRRTVLIIASLAAVYTACRTTQPPGTENQLPIESVTTEREPIQTVPDSPAGQTAPVTAPTGDGGVPPEPDAP